MKIAIASGKGGTGKTTIAANLAQSCARRSKSEVWLLDCDVEAPNAALFLQPTFDQEKESIRLMPIFNQEKCDGCGRCVQECTYNAIAVAGGKVIFFKELCHACGSCTLNCPQAAITEEPETIGWLQAGHSDELNFAQGKLKVGFSSPVPVIRDLKKWALQHASQEALIFLDASPGCTCPVVETLRDADAALLVTEPTPFGLHDLKLIVQVVQDQMELPCGVVLNKSGENDGLIEDFCAEKQIPILMRLPLSRQIAQVYSEGTLLIDALPELEKPFQVLADQLQSFVRQKPEGGK